MFIYIYIVKIGTGRFPTNQLGSPVPSNQLTVLGHHGWTLFCTIATEFPKSGCPEPMLPSHKLVKPERIELDRDWMSAASTYIYIFIYLFS